MLIKIILNLLFMVVVLESLLEVFLICHWFVLEHAIVIMLWIGAALLTQSAVGADALIGSSR